MINFSKVSILNFKDQRLLTLNIGICIVLMNELISLLGNHLFTSRNRWSYKRGSNLCIYALVLESNSVQELWSNSFNANRPIGSIETNRMNVRRADFAPFVLLSKHFLGKKCLVSVDIFLNSWKMAAYCTSNHHKKNVVKM